MTVDRVQRFFPDHFTATASGCWLWHKATTKAGYGTVIIAGRQWSAHRATYEMLVGPIGDGLDLDHLCRVRNCINPAHLEPVIRQINLLRGETLAAFNAVKTHCPQGHAYDEANTARYGTRRYCRACQRDRNAARKSTVKDVA